MKFQEGKPKMSLMYASFIEEVVRVREYGIKKHGSAEGWKTTTVIQHLDSALRHLIAYKAWFLSESVGEEYDPESGLDHLAHCACNLMFEIERKHRKEESPGFTPPNVKEALAQIEKQDNFDDHDPNLQGD